MSGWIVPIKDDYTEYPLNSNSFYITTESVAGGSDRVSFALVSDSGYSFTLINWLFRNWRYYINSCTISDDSVKFPVTPPTDVNKTWEITLTTEDIKIKCNSLQVLHFIFNSSYSGACTSYVKGKIATRIRFFSTDSATKMFKSDQVGK